MAKDHISVCICTYHRNEMLVRLLEKLKDQETEGLFDYSLVVVDNDEAGPAKETVDRSRVDSQLDIIYEIEPEQTIPAARNHALRLARGNYVAIIDDDEFPPPHWLKTLYKAIQSFGVDGALGPVRPFFDSPPPRWLLKGRFCERPTYRTGTLLEWNQTRTGNVLLKKSVFDRHNIRFDPKCRTSGSDRLFFKQAIGLGHRFIAVEEAPVHEIVPPARFKKGYYLRRALVHGFNAYRNNADELRFWGRAAILSKSFIAMGVYGLGLPVCACRGSHILVKCLESGGYYLSQFCAVFGIELVKKRDF